MRVTWKHAFSSAQVETRPALSWMWGVYVLIHGLQLYEGRTGPEWTPGPDE